VIIPRYRVHAVKLATLTIDRAGVTYGRGYGTKMDIPVWCAAIEGEGRRILVDTGIADATKWMPYHPCVVTPLPAALAELGWSLNDVDVVINSHLHYDHCENNIKLPNAQFYVSASEWEFAAHPTETQAWSYNIDWTSPELTYMNYTMINTDHYDVCPGIRVIKTPGHTPGHQSVLVNTDEGLVCIAGDAACVMENLSDRVPPTVHVSVDEALRSIDKMCSLADRIFMNHDPDLTDFQNSNFPLVPVHK
jgi:glyoxylase-like metal-dependent hydrolase (beta-lactamase superfamily II)